MPLRGALALFFGFLVTSCYAMTEAESLLAIKNKVGSNSYNLDTWTSDSDPCNSTWYGVTCFNNTVTKLNLTKAGLTGEIPSEIGNLVNLEVLDLQSNSLTGSIPSSFKNLVNLKALNFSRNMLGGSFPDVLLDMTNLVDLRCGGCNLKGQLPTGIKRLSNLKYLHINNNSFSGDLPEELYALEELIQLNLWGNPLGTNLSAHLGLLKNLNWLKMHDCQLSGTLPEEWGINLTNIDTLHLDNNKLTGEIPTSWSNMKNLSELNLANNRLNGQVPSWLENATLLNTWLDCNFFTGSRPTLPYSKFKSLDGNCYTGEADTRKKICIDGKSCYPSHHIKPWIIVLIVIAIMCVVTPLIIWLYCKHRRRSKRRRRRKMNFNIDDFPNTIKGFTLEQISNATNKFSKGHEIGHGGFGKVYIGYFEDGKPVAIKKANPNKVLDSTEFKNEIRLLSRLHHRHLVHLLGWCDEDENQILVYEYMQNGNLQERLLGNKYEPLNFYQRVDIAVGIARGLDYLHSFADPPVIHRDMKPSNVLLDENLVAKISDFGISRDTLMLRTHVSTRPAGTAGYLDPEYFLRDQLTTSSDVYAFGIILLQLITGQQVINEERNLDVNLVEWVRETLKLGIHEVVDPRLGHDYPKDVFEEIANLGLQCASLNRKDRPTLQEVLQRLESFLTELTKPTVTEDETVVLLDKPASSEIECSTNNIPTISLWSKLSPR